MPRYEIVSKFCVVGTLLKRKVFRSFFQIFQGRLQSAVAAHKANNETLNATAGTGASSSAAGQMSSHKVEEENA